jgi:asparagine synthase (glutamine-hydrolysing)
LPRIAGVIGRKSEEQVTLMLDVLQRGDLYHRQVFFGHLVSGLEFSIGAVAQRQHASQLQLETSSGNPTVCDGCPQNQFAKVTVNNSRYIRLERDIIGAKPLFYGLDSSSGILAFASERKALWAIEIDHAERVKPGQIIDISDLNSIEKRTIPCSPLRDTAVVFDEMYAVDELIKLLKVTINERSNCNMGLAFSGGVDSTLLWALLEDREDTILYTVGIAGSHDIKVAVNSARLLNVDIRIIQLTLADIEYLLPQVIRAIESHNPTDVAIAIPLYSIFHASRLDGNRLVMTGQGADELFGGYKRHLYAHASSQDALSEMLKQDILYIAQKNLERDNLTASSNTVELILPYLDLGVVSFASKIATQLKIKDGVNKYILRKAAARFLPYQIAYRDKKAMQYGSGVDRVLNMLARNYFRGQEDKRGIMGRYLKVVAEENGIQVAE